MSWIGRSLFLLLVFLAIERPPEGDQALPQKMTLSSFEAKELELIPGIGSVYSEKMKSFKGEDWQQIRGLGPKRSALLREVIQIK